MTDSTKNQQDPSTKQRRKRPNRPKTEKFVALVVDALRDGPLPLVDLEKAYDQAMKKRFPGIVGAPACAAVVSDSPKFRLSPSGVVSSSSRASAKSAVSLILARLANEEFVPLRDFHDGRDPAKVRADVNACAQLVVSSRGNVRLVSSTTTTTTKSTAKKTKKKKTKAATDDDERKPSDAELLKRFPSIQGLEDVTASDLHPPPQRKQPNRPKLEPRAVVLVRNVTHCMETDVLEAFSAYKPFGASNVGEKKLSYVFFSSEQDASRAVKGVVRVQHNDQLQIGPCRCSMSDVPSFYNLAAVIAAMSSSSDRSSVPRRRLTSKQQKAMEKERAQASRKEKENLKRFPPLGDTTTSTTTSNSWGSSFASVAKAPPPPQQQSVSTAVVSPSSHFNADEEFALTEMAMLEARKLDRRREAEEEAERERAVAQIAIDAQNERIAEERRAMRDERERAAGEERRRLAEQERFLLEQERLIRERRAVEAAHLPLDLLGSPPDKTSALSIAADADAFAASNASSTAASFVDVSSTPPAAVVVQQPKSWATKAAEDSGPKLVSLFAGEGQKVVGVDRISRPAIGVVSGASGNAEPQCAWGETTAPSMGHGGGSKSIEFPKLGDEASTREPIGPPRGATGRSMLRNPSNGHSHYSRPSLRSSTSRFDQTSAEDAARGVSVRAVVFPTEESIPLRVDAYTTGGDVKSMLLTRSSVKNVFPEEVRRRISPDDTHLLRVVVSGRDVSDRDSLLSRGVTSDSVLEVIVRQMQ